MFALYHRGDFDIKYWYYQIVILIMSAKSMNNKVKVRISITINPKLDNMLQEVSQTAGKSKSFLIEEAVKEFLKKKLDNDSRELAKLKFEDLPSEEEWTVIQDI
jgi:predicted DNA-binding protein